MTETCSKIIGYGASTQIIVLTSQITKTAIRKFYNAQKVTADRSGREV
jgi:hypothetical protein